MLRQLLLAIPFGVAWIALTANASIGSFAVGYSISVVILTLLFPNKTKGRKRELRVIDRTTASIQYVAILFRDVYLSSIDVARRVIQPTIPLKPGIIAVPTTFVPDPGDELIADTIAAVSAHGITITPGELVVDFDGSSIMYVHCLDAAASLNNAASNQAKRMALLRRIFQ